MVEWPFHIPLTLTLFLISEKFSAIESHWGEMEDMARMNEMKEDCQLRLENLKRQYSVLVGVMKKHKHVFPMQNPQIFEQLEQYEKEVNYFFVCEKHYFEGQLFV